MPQKLRIVSYAEAVTFLVLLAGTVLHRVFNNDAGEGIISVMGPVHGVVFLIYLVLVLKVRASQGWSLGQTLLVILAAAIPFGGFFVGRHLKDEEPAGLHGENIAT